jgi:hypothetical protein
MELKTLLPFLCPKCQSEPEVYPGGMVYCKENRILAFWRGADGWEIWPRVNETSFLKIYADGRVDLRRLVESIENENPTCFFCGRENVWYELIHIDSEPKIEMIHCSICRKAGILNLIDLKFFPFENITREQFLKSVESVKNRKKLILT